MSKPIVFNTLGYEDAVDQSFIDEWEQAESETEEQSLKWVRDVIENPEYWEQAIKASKEESVRQAKILEQGRIPTVYDDDYVDDDDYDDDECYPDDE